LDWTPPNPRAALGASHGFDEPFVWNVADAARFPLADRDASAAAL